MDREAKRIADALIFCNEGAGCEDCPVFGENRPCMNDLNAASLIERLSAELEAAKRDINEMLAEQGGNLDLCHWCKAKCQGMTDYEKCDAKSEWRGLCAENGGAE